MKAETKIKGILVNFYRDGRDRDYHNALKNATKDILSLLQEQKEDFYCQDYQIDVAAGDNIPVKCKEQCDYCAQP